MRLKHHRQIVEMLYQEWDLGKTSSKAVGKTCAVIYWLEILSEAEQLIFEKQNGDLVGVCGYAKWRSKRHLVRKHFCKILAQILTYSPLVKDTKSLIQYGKDYDYLPLELAGHFDGEIAILIVDQKYRGHGLGVEMLSKVFRLAQDDGLQNLQILTDQSCNFRFYEKMGCQKVYETLVMNGEPDECGKISHEKGYVYEKLLVAKPNEVSIPIC